MDAPYDAYARLALSSVDPRSLRAAADAFIALGDGDRARDILRMAMRLGDMRTALAIIDAAPELGIDVPAPDAVDRWIVERGIRGFDLSRDDRDGLYFVAEEDAEFLRLVVTRRFRGEAAFWRTALAGAAADPAFPPVRRALLAKLAAGEPPIEPIPPNRRDGVDAAFRAFCARRGIEVLRRLQRGSDGTDLKSEVYLILDADGIAKVAKEVIRGRDAADRHIDGEPEFYSRLGLRPFLPRCYGVDTLDDGTEMMRLSIVYGQELDAFIARPLPIGQACTVIAALASALADLHGSGVLHLDVRPANAKANGGDVALLDLSSARSVGDPRAVVDAPMADPRFAAPETTLRHLASAATDVFQLGVLAHMLLAGAHPFDDASVGAGAACDRERDILRHALPAAIRPYEPIDGSRTAGLVARMLAKDPSERPTAADVAFAFRDHAGTPVSHRPRPHRPRPPGNAVLFPARMGIPHKGHVEFIARLIELGLYPIISLQRSYTLTDRDPVPKWRVMKMVARSLMAKGFDPGSFRFILTPFFRTDEEHRMHFAMMPGRQDLVAVASSNPSVRGLVPGLPLIDQRTVFGHEGEDYDERSWGERLRTAVRAGDRRAFDELAAEGVEEVMPLEELRRTYGRPSIEFVRGRVEAALVRQDGSEAVRGRVLRYLTPQESLMRRMAARGSEATILDPYANDTVVAVDGRRCALRDAGIGTDDDGNVTIFFTLEPSE